MTAAPRTFWKVSSRVTVGVSLVALLLGLVGAIFVPADSANILVPAWLLIGVVALFVAARLGRDEASRGMQRVTAIAGGAIVAVALGLLAPLAAPRPQVSETRTLRLVSFNMYKSNGDADRAVRWLLAQRADIIILLEATAAHDAALARLRQDYRYVYPCSRSGKCSTKVFSRIPAIGYWPLAKGDADNRLALSAVTLHFDVAGAVVPVTAVHLSHPWPLGGQQDELKALGQALSTLGRGGIIAGDFNSAPWTFAMRRLAAKADARLASGATGTWPAYGLQLPVLPLDQIYLGRCIAARSVTRGPALGSDHLPLVVDLGIAPCRG